MKEVIVILEDADNVVSPFAKMPEIVRCKDCKWNSGYGRGMYACFCTCYKTGSPHKDNWFCADGERKDGDDE